MDFLKEREKQPFGSGHLVDCDGFRRQITTQEDQWGLVSFDPDNVHSISFVKSFVQNSRIISEREIYVCKQHSYMK